LAAPLASNGPKIAGEEHGEELVTCCNLPAFVRLTSPKDEVEDDLKAAKATAVDEAAK
jgi:hypothetical protein